MYKKQTPSGKDDGAWEMGVHQKGGHYARKYDYHALMSFTFES